MSVINTNMNAQLAANAITKNERAMTQTMERLSTGLRINSAKDDAAGLGIATRMTTQVNGLNQAVRNANDAMSIVATADGAAVEITDMLQRMRELAVQAASETISAADVTNIDVEFKQLATGIEQIANNTQFNGMNVMNGDGRAGNDTNGSFTFNLGANASQTETLDFNDFNLAGGAAVAATPAKFTFDGVTDTTLTAAKIAGNDVTLSIDGTDHVIDVSAVGTGATKAVVAFAFTDANVAAAVESADGFTVKDVNNVTYAVTDIESMTSVSQVVDSWNDNHAASSGFTASETLDAGGATTHFVLTQTSDPATVVDASAMVITAVDASGDAGYLTAGALTHTTDTDSVLASLTVTQAIGGMTASAVNGFNATSATNTLVMTQAAGSAFTGDMSSTMGGVASTTVTGVSASVGGVMGADLSGMVAATATITSTTAGILTTLDTAITGVQSQRASFGAMSNRLEHAVDNLTNVSQNSSASLSRIQDADYAAETTELARTQIIAQAATAMLSQANQQAQSVLALLK